MFPAECLRGPEVHSMGVGVVFLPLAVCIFSEVAYDCAGSACGFECLVGIPVMHVCGHGKTPM